MTEEAACADWVLVVSRSSHHTSACLTVSFEEAVPQMSEYKFARLFALVSLFAILMVIFGGLPGAAQVWEHTP
jgi:hypothetical protein